MIKSHLLDLPIKLQRGNKRDNFFEFTSTFRTIQENKNPKKQLSFKGLCFGCGDRI